MNLSEWADDRPRPAPRTGFLASDSWSLPVAQRPILTTDNQFLIGRWLALTSPDVPRPQIVEGDR